MDDHDLVLKKKKEALSTEGDAEASGIARSTNRFFAARTESGENDIYPYSLVLQRIYDDLSEKNPELMDGNKFTMIRPRV